MRGARHAGGDDEVPVAHPRAAGHRHSTSGRIECERAHAEHQVDVVVGVPRTRPQGQIGGIRLSGQQRLRERRTVVGCVKLVAEQPDRPVPAAGAQRLAAALGGEAGADDDHAGAHDARPSRGRAARTGRRPITRRRKSARIGAPVASMKVRSHGVDASVPAPTAWATPSA